MTSAHTIVYENPRDWVNKLSISEPKIPLAEALRELKLLKTKWESCVFYPWGDETLHKLVLIYDDDAWRSECASYVNDCIVDLLDDQNSTSTVWRFHGLLQMIHQDFFLHQSDNLHFEKWQLLASGAVKPQSENEYWVSLLLGPQEQKVFVDRFAELNALADLTLPSGPEDIRFICSRLAGSERFAQSSADYNVLCRRLAVSAFWTWLNRSVDDLKKPMTLELLNDADTNPLLRWYCLGMINPRTHPVASSDREYYASVGQHFEKFITGNTSWYTEQADLMLDAYLEVSKLLRDRLKIERYAWLETWLLEMQYAQNPNARVELQQLVDDKAVLWWLKPDWRQHQPLFDSLQLDRIEIIEQCRAKDALLSQQPSVNLPTTLSW